MRILYISYDGLSDSLGQSQIIPYLSGLSDMGYEITILSCEKRNKLIFLKNQIQNQISNKKIKWHYEIFKKNPPILSTLLNMLSLRKRATLLHKENKFSATHCRSYIAGIIGLGLKNRFNVKLIFDMRGFWADERVEGGLWNLNNPVYRFTYNYFKKKEIKLLSSADHTIALTEKAKHIIHSWKMVRSQPIPIKVIPCCADTNHFSREKVDHQTINLLKRDLGIIKSDFILSYLGSVGTWYCLDEMLAFFSRLIVARPNSKFLFITQDDPKIIFSSANKHGISDDKLMVHSAPYFQVPLYLTMSSMSIFFIKPSYSKNASSPTKLAETLSMGIPVICNSGIGDTDDIIRNGNCGLLIPEFNKKEFDKAISQIETILHQPAEEIREYAKQNFSLATGVLKYNEVYRSLLANLTR